MAIRNIMKYKGYSLINIIGLATGMACAMLILLWILEQLSYDKFHTNSERIFRVCVDLKAGNHMIYPMSMPPLTPVLINEYPEVENAVRIQRPRKFSIKYQEKLFTEDLVCFADNSLFEVFTFPFIKGDSQNALTNPYTVVISETMARKYFGENDPIGQMLKINGNDDYVVTGVIKNIPGNSHFRFNMACSYETLYAQNRNAMENWFHIQFYAYLLLKDKQSAQVLEDKLPKLVDQYIGEQLKGFGGSLKLFLQPLSDIHLFSELPGDIAPQGDIVYIYLFSGIASLILVLTIINFINLTTARSSIRAREIAIRKTLGSFRRHITIQFLGESIVISFFALVLAGILFTIFVPFFQDLLGYKFNLTLIDVPWVSLIFVLIALLTGILAGIYPALHLAAFQPIRIFRDRDISGNPRSRLRDLLVLFQFAISIVMIIGTIAIYKQINFMKNKKLGFNKEQVVIIPGIKQMMKQHSFTTIQHEFSSLRGVLSVGGASLMPGTGTQKGLFQPVGYSDKEHQLMERLHVDPNYINTLGIEMSCGRNYSDDYALDKTNAIIINETAARKFGWENPLEKSFIFHEEENGEEKIVHKQVIGVVKDFHSTSLHKPVEPLVILNDASGINFLAVRILADDVSSILKRIEQKWNILSPHKVFRSYFLDNIFDQLYKEEERFGKLILSFSILAIFIGCLGLFGLVSFFADRQSKNIGIRKVFGASIKNIVGLYIKDFSKYALIGNVIAWPVAYYLTMIWFANFAYQTSVTWWVYFAAGAVTFVIVLITISYQTIKSATSDPVKAIRYE